MAGHPGVDQALQARGGSSFKKTSLADLGGLPTRKQVDKAKKKRKGKLGGGPKITATVTKQSFTPGPSRGVKEALAAKPRKK